MDIESIRLFVRAAEKLNISEAGRELGLAPAVASARLAKLEKCLEADLLHRSTRKVTLSLEGAEFLPYAREILAQENAARAALGLGRAHVSGTLRFTAPSSFAQLYIAPLLPVFLEQYPEIHLDLRLSDAVFDLIEGSFDLALRNAVPEDTSLKGRKLSDDKRILCSSPSYLKRFGTPASPVELRKHQLIAFKNQTPRMMIAPDGVEALFDPLSAGCRLVVDDGASQKSATLAGAGISLNSLWSVHREIERGSLVRLFPEYKMQEQTALWLLYPKSNVLTAKVRVFIDFLMQRIAKNPPWEKGIDLL